MSKKTKQEAAQATNVFQFTLAGLILFSLALMAGAAFCTYAFTDGRHAPTETGAAVDPKDKSSSVRTGAWGTLLTRDIQIERPAEYQTEEVANPQPEVWTFAKMKPAAVKSFLAQHGVAAAEAEAAGEFIERDTGTLLSPSEKFICDLSPDQRRKLYSALAGYGVNQYLDFPYVFPGDDLQGIYADPRLNADDVALLRRLVYPNGTSEQLSDYQLLLEKIPTVERRIAMTRALSRQSAVLARLAVQPDADIDKIAAYWGKMPNVRFTDIRPLMESLKQLPGGGSLSLLYLLPKFARERLYTFPLPGQPGDPAMDCHWTTFNFNSETPDNRFSNPEFAVPYLQKNYYQIAAPSVYGDIVLLVNDRQEAKHSAVYIADDLVFTKNGNNYRQPWMLMRIPELLSMYPATPPMKAVYMRRKTS